MAAHRIHTLLLGFGFVEALALSFTIASRHLYIRFSDQQMPGGRPTANTFGVLWQFIREREPGFVAMGCVGLLILWQRKMPRKKKAFDTDKRGTPSAKRKPGRPKVDEGELLQFRDSLLHLLTVKWERIGWRLSRARSREALRKALRPLERDGGSLGHWIASFLRASSEPATPVQIRETSIVMGREVANNQSIQQKYDLLCQRYDQVEAASNIATEGANRTILNELKRRGNKMDECERMLLSSKYKLADLENTLANQRAFFVQTELLRFQRRGYAHNPKVLANAMAGLPEIGCRRSFTICSKTDSPLWPSSRYQIFQAIERIWGLRGPRSGQALVDLYRSEVQKLPRTIRVKVRVKMRGTSKVRVKQETRDNHARTLLFENWRHLRMAIERIPVCVHPKVVPYLITNRFFSNIGKPRTPEDEVLNNMEALQI